MLLQPPNLPSEPLVTAFHPGHEGLILPNPWDTKVWSFLTPPLPCSSQLQAVKPVCACVCVCRRMHACMHAYVCGCAYASMRVCIACIRACVHVQVHACVCVCMCMRMLLRVHASMCVCVHVQVHACTHMCLHTQEGLKAAYSVSQPRSSSVAELFLNTVCSARSLHSAFRPLNAYMQLW